MKKIVLAFDSFKGCLSAKEACHAAQSGIKTVCPDTEVVCLPMSDGGEGMVDCLTMALELTAHHVRVHGPLMEDVVASYAISANGKTAYMEMASASGLMLVPVEKRNPMITTTYGVGEMVLDAVRKGCQEIVMGIGGSATCDGGKGMVEFLQPYIKTICGRCLIDSREVKVTVASDVTNPMYGFLGAAYVFAPQKGANPEQVVLLDQQLRDFAEMTEKAGYATKELAQHPGAGAAGGLGYALMAYLNAELRSGIELMLDVVGFDNHLKGTDMILTGEGKSDCQTLMGKVPLGILRRAQCYAIPVSLLSGTIEDRDELLKAGFCHVLSINEEDTRPLRELLRKEVASDNLRKTIESLF